MAELATLGLPAGLPGTDIIALTPQYESGETGITGPVASIEDTGQLIRWVKKEIALAEPQVLAWREQAREAWRFYDGHQISEKDLDILRRDKRPDIAVNEIQKFIKFASGIERRTQQALMFAGRNQGDAQSAGFGELLSKSYQWFVDQSSADDERSQAFLSKLISGIGICDTGLSRITDPDGVPRYNYCDTFDFYWPETSKANFGLDGTSPPRWLARESFMDVEEAIRKWPDESLLLRAAAGSGPTSDTQFPDFGRGAGQPIRYVVPYIQTEPLNKNGGSETSKPGKVPILEWQYFKDEPGFFFFDPIEKDATWLNQTDFRRLRSRYRKLFKTEITDYDEHDHRVYKRAFFLSRRILLGDVKDLPTNNAGYTWNVMTGAWDRADKVFYGMIRLFMSPQRFANVMFRQVLEIMGAQTKGGMIAETGAMTVAQKRDFEETGARPGSVNMVQPGAVSMNRLLPKQLPQVPQGSMQVLDFLMKVMGEISGLSSSLVGNELSNTPGVALRRRMTTGMLLLAAEFDSLSRFRKREGRLVFEFMKLLADDRWVRIGGAYDAQYIQLTKDPFAFKYDIVLDEADQDPNLRQYYTDQIVTLAPILIRTGNFIPELLDYANLPAELREKLKQSITQSAQQKQEMAQMGMSVGGRGKPRGIEEIKADTALKGARTAEHLAKAKAMAHGQIRDDLSKIFDGLLAAHKEQRETKQLSLEALQKLVMPFAQNQMGGNR